MKVHEYQAKEILRRFGVPLVGGGAGATPDEAVKVAEEIGGDLWVVKSQIHAGGRGMGRFKEQVDADQIAIAAKGEKAGGEGGVRLARSIDEVRKHAESMLGDTLVTKQTGLEGKTVRTSEWFERDSGLYVMIQGLYEEYPTAVELSNWRWASESTPSLPEPRGERWSYDFDLVYKEEDGD